MTEIKKSSTMHGLAIGASVVALLSFFLPFIQVEFFVKLSLSGIEFIGAAIEEGQVQASLSVLSLILCVVGIICAIKAKKNNKAAAGTIVASAIGMFMMVVAMYDSEADIIVYINYATFGFYLYEIMSLVAIVVSIPIIQMGEGSPVTKEKKKFNIPKITLPKLDIKIPEKPPKSAGNVCPKCKKVQDKGAVFCRYCGAPLVKQEYSDPLSPTTPRTSGKDGKVVCPKCGARHAAGTADCKYCGTAIGGRSGSFIYGREPINPVPVKPNKDARTQICPKCGAKHIAGTTKCKYCGTPMK